MISYRKLFVLLAEYGMKKTDLLEIISSPTLAKLSKGEVIKTDIVEKICIYLNCQPSDIMEVIQTDELIDKNGKVQGRLITKDVLDQYENDSIPMRESYISFNPNAEDIDDEDIHYISRTAITDDM